MPARMPAVFISHGAPDALLKAPETMHDFSGLAPALAERAVSLLFHASMENENFPRPSISQVFETTQLSGVMNLSEVGNVAFRR